MLEYFQYLYIKYRPFPKIIKNYNKFIFDKLNDDLVLKLQQAMTNNIGGLYIIDNIYNSNIDKSLELYKKHGNFSIFYDLKDEADFFNSFNSSFKNINRFNLFNAIKENYVIVFYNFNESHLKYLLHYCLSESLKLNNVNIIVSTKSENINIFKDINDSIGTHVIQ